MKKILITTLAFMMIGCTDADNATRVLDNAGFTDIKITGYKFFSCSEDDFQHTGFTAIGPTGKPVNGTVCSGLFLKNSTIRYE
ncbi:lipoprotein [Klebsiella phage KP185]|nr:lipoprotein [Klebsiella phage KP185]